MSKKWVKISAICVLFILLISLVCCNVISAIPVDGIWISEDPHVVLDLTKLNQTPIIELVYNGEIEEFNIGYGDEGRFRIYPLLSDNEQGVHASDILWEGYIIQYGNRVRLKSDDGYLNLWLTELEMINF